LLIFQDEILISFPEVGITMSRTIDLRDLLPELAAGRPMATKLISARLLKEPPYERLRAGKIELPAEKEMRRSVNAALHGFFQDIYTRISARLSPDVRTNLDQLLTIPEGESVSRFEKLKADPRSPGVESLKHEIEKLQQLRAVGIRAEDLADVPPQALLILKRRARNERAGEMHEHPEAIRYTLLACFIHLRSSEVTDDVTRMMIEIIQAQQEGTCDRRQ